MDDFKIESRDIDRENIEIDILFRYRSPIDRRIIVKSVGKYQNKILCVYLYFMHHMDTINNILLYFPNM